MLRSSFRKIFLARSREAVFLLARMPLTEANRPALSAAARRASVDCLLAARFPLVRLCHGIAVLASSAAGPGIPEGAARIRALRAALAAAEAEAGLSDGPGSAVSGTPGVYPSGCPCARIVPVRGRLPLSSSRVEAAVTSKAGLRILRFRPSGLKGSPQDLSERLSDLVRRDILRGLYAITGNRPGSAAREFVLLVPDRPSADDTGQAPGADPLEGFPVAGRIRTLVRADADTPEDLAGFELVDGDPGEARSESDSAGKISSRGLTGTPAAVPAARSGKPAGQVRRIARDGEYRNAAVLRAEIPDLLSTLRGVDARRAAAFLNRVLRRLGTCVEASGGLVDTCSGGGLSAFWGAPVSSGRDAEAAGRAALGMRRVVAALNRGRADSGQPPLRLYCALDAGPVLAARLGTEDREAYTVAGQAVLRCAGIGFRNGRWGTDILVSEYAMRLMGSAFRFQALDKLDPEGDGGQVGIYALLGRSGDSSGPRNLGDLRKLIGTGS